MRPNQGQDSGEQKKSVFDRLGRQLDTGRGSNRRSPAQYVEHQMHPGGMHEPPPPPPPLDFGAGGAGSGSGGGGGGVRYMRGDGHPDMDWRYQQNDRRNMAFGRDRYQVGPSMPMPMPPPPPHYDMDGMPPGRQPPPYYPPPPHFQPGPQGPLPPQQQQQPPPQLMGGPEPMPAGMHHQRRPSPKYDRHGNPIRGSMRMEQSRCVTSPRNFMGPPMPGPMLPASGYDMMPMRPEMYPPNRWPENPDLGPQMHVGRLLPDNRFMEPPNPSTRFPQQQQQQQQQMKSPMLLNPEMVGGPPNLEAPRYSKWRERRDVITNLDRQTAQSSSKTDSLKSSLQQSENKGNMLKKSKNVRSGEQAGTKKQSAESQAATEATKEKKESTPSKSSNNKDDSNKDSKNGPQDISDGEIVDDEDSSDDSDVANEPPSLNSIDSDLKFEQNNRQRAAFVRKPTESQPIYEVGKRRRLHERDEYSMDYETISDEELDDFMSEKKLGEDEKGQGRGAGKNSSEIELLNALGLDWANLIEMTKQSRKDTQTSDSALRRFSLPNYLPTLGISRELAGPEIYDLMMKVIQ
jgi:hypothetical protein